MPRKVAGVCVVSLLQPVTDGVQHSVWRLDGWW